MAVDQKGSRRSFLTRLIVAWSSFVVIPISYVISQFIIPPRNLEREASRFVLGKIGEMPTEGAKLFKVKKKPLMVVRTQGGHLKALSAVCTHLGCIIEYRPEMKSFHCNCHESVFDLDGKNISGPAPNPLPPFLLEINGEDVVVTDVRIKA